MRNLAIFGVSKLGQGPWRPGKKIWSIAIFGGCEVDFTQVVLDEEVTRLVAISIIGTNKVIAPKGVPISVSGVSILGARSVKRVRAWDATPSSSKSIAINATSFLGWFEITEHPG